MFLERFNSDKCHFKRFLHVHGHEYKNWIRYAKFEERNGFVANARAVYEQMLEFFGEENMGEHMLIAFAQFEERQKEYERARVIYQFGLGEHSLCLFVWIKHLDNLPKEQTTELFKSLTLHEKKFGERIRIETVIVAKRRHQYEEVGNIFTKQKTFLFLYIFLFGKNSKNLSVNPNPQFFQISAS